MSMERTELKNIGGMGICHMGVVKEGEKKQRQGEKRTVRQTSSDKIAAK